MFEDLINFIGNASKDEIIKILKDNGVKFKSDIMEDNMNKELEIMKYIESEMIRVNDECVRLHFDCDLRLWQDKQLELETIERIYEELNSKFFNGKL